MTEHIWCIQDTNEQIIALIDHVAKKCQYGDDMSALSEAERIFYITQTLEMEVNNGGFAQFFYNSSGDFSNELAAAFTQIGAVKTAQICQKAISAFGQEIPTGRAEAVEMLDEWVLLEIHDILCECDGQFYAYEEDLNTLNWAFVMKRKADFT